MEERAQKVSLFRRTGFLLAGLSAIFLFIDATLLSGNNGSSDQAPDAIYIIIVGLGIPLFSISALVASLHWIQPILLLIITPIFLQARASSMFSLGSFIGAEILLARMSFFETSKLPKYFLTILYFYLSEILIGSSIGMNSLEITAPIIFITAYLFFLILVYGDDWKVYLIQPKPSLSLSALKISPMEAEYLKILLAGSSIKEIAIDGKIKESTVRNTLANVYRKFDVHDKASLMAKCEKYRLLD